MKVSPLNAKTYIKKVRGLMYDGDDIKVVNIVVRATNDHNGKTISFSDDKSVMIHIAYEDISDLIKFLVNRG